MKKQIGLFCLLMVIEIPFGNLFSQNIQTKPTRQSSFEAFAQGNYEKAYKEFSELLVTYTRDPLYKYYSGVCLVKLNKNPGEATKLLQQALQEGGAVKTLPNDVLFYLGRAQQLSGKYSDAAESYNLYTDRVGKKVSKEMGVPEFLQQCLQKKGQIAVSDLKPAFSSDNDKIDTVKRAVTAKIEEPILKATEKSTSKNEKLSDKYEKILSEAIEYQYKADSVNSVISEQKKKIESVTGTDKISLRMEIRDNEKAAASYQASADQKYHEAQLLMNPKSDSTLQLKENFRQTEYKGGNDSSKKSENKIGNPVNKNSDTARVIIPAIISRMDIFSFFDVAGKTATDPNNKIVIDPEVPPGLIYRIQLAVFRNPVVPGFFKGINPVYGFRIEGTDKIIYYAGMFRKASDAAKALATVKGKGFKDAFIVALSENKHISADRASLLEKDWGRKPFYSIDKIMADKQSDTLTPTLAFRVEAIRSIKPLTEDVVEESGRWQETEVWIFNSSTTGK